MNSKLKISIILLTIKMIILSQEIIQILIIILIQTIILNKTTMTQDLMITGIITKTQTAKAI